MSTPYSYTVDACQSLEQSISPPRLARYLAASDQDKKAALELYRWNSELSQSMTFALHMVEVCLRNAIAESIQAAFGSEWYTQARFKINLGDYWAGRLEKAIETKQKEAGYKRREMNSGDIVSEMTFGFWREFLKAPYDKHIWNKKNSSGQLILAVAFPHLPTYKSRQNIYNNVNDLVKLRNRISHYEAIYDRSSLDRQHGKAIEAIGWICKDTKLWLEHHSTFPDVLAYRNQALPAISKPVPKPKKRDTALSKPRKREKALPTE